MHCSFGIDLVNTIKLENPHLWTNEFKAEIAELMQKGVELEYKYAEDTMPRGVLGSMRRCSRSICGSSRIEMSADRMDPLFEKADNPFPWMAEMIDLKKEKNFFETRVIEYQTGGALSWD
jgi:ribonucleoside-diphosphate reductase beta chain